MAEGGVEEESGGDMLGPAVAPVHQPSPAVNNIVKTEEVRDDVILPCFLISGGLCRTSSIYIMRGCDPSPCIINIYTIICINYSRENIFARI